MQEIIRVRTLQPRKEIIERGIGKVYRYNERSGEKCTGFHCCSCSRGIREC